MQWSLKQHQCVCKEHSSLDHLENYLLAFSIIRARPNPSQYVFTGYYMPSRNRWNATPCANEELLHTDKRRSRSFPLQLARVDDGRSLVVLDGTALGAGSLDGLDNLQRVIIGDLAEDDVSGVQPRSDDSGDEELGTVARVGRLAGNGWHSVATKSTHVLGPALAMDSKPGLSCWRVKFSSANFSP